MPRPLSIAVGLLMIAAFIALAIWLAIRTLKKTEDPPKLIFKWVITLVFAGLLLWYSASTGGGSLAIPFACVLFGIIMSVTWAPHIGAFLARPLTAMFDGGTEEIEPQAFYSTAISQRKLGRYDEAVKQIRQQLEKFPHDFRGQLLLAEIHAENLNDLHGAQHLIQCICNQTEHAPANISAALMQLADWQLKYWQDATAARETLGQIQTRFPDSPFANVAAQRIAHLGESHQFLQAHDRRKIQLREGVEDFGLKGGMVDPRPPEQDPAAKAAELVKQLEQHPLDAEAREQLATIYAEHYQRLDYAIDQLEQIIQQPGQNPKQIVRVLNMIADFQMKHAEDVEGAKKTLQRIIDLYPNLAAATSAAQRMAYLKLELRSKTKSESVELGAYEQDIGLKKKL